MFAKFKFHGAFLILLYFSMLLLNIEGKRFILKLVASYIFILFSLNFTAKIADKRLFKKIQRYNRSKKKK